MGVFDSIKTEKITYRDAVTKCSTIIGKLATAGRKLKRILDTTSIILYMSFNILNLEGVVFDDYQRIKLVGSILDVIA